MFKAFLISPLQSRTSAAKPPSVTSRLVKKKKISLDQIIAQVYVTLSNQKNLQPYGHLLKHITSLYNHSIAEKPNIYFFLKKELISFRFNSIMNTYKNAR